MSFKGMTPPSSLEKMSKHAEHMIIRPVKNGEQTLLRFSLCASAHILSTLMFACPEEALAIPKFARSYSVTCQTCHVLPPKLAPMGQEFVARRYQFGNEGLRRTSTVPVAAWVSLLGHQQPGKDSMRGFPNRVEFIASDAISTKLSYFVEWRALSLELHGDGSLRDRSGRFEDLFVIAELSNNISVTVGQFRLLSQVDVSQRLSISEPLPFSSSLRGTQSSTSRLTGLRSFSPSGRSPALRLQYRHEVFGPERHADGWFSVFNLPLTGEFSLPLTRDARKEASFELEAVPKGVFLESFLRRGLTGVGAHVFAGTNDRFLAQVVGTTRYDDLYLSAVIGTGKDEKSKTTNMMLEAELNPLPWGVLAVRLEHQTGVRRKPAITPYGVVHFPGGSYTVRLSVEKRLQKNNNQTFVEMSLIF